MPSESSPSPTGAAAPSTTGAPASSTATWVDDLDVDPQWSAPLADYQPWPNPATDPAGRPPSRTRWSPALVVTAIVVSLALVVAGVWGLGGFDKRADLLTDRAPGEAIETGPYVFTFTDVTAQRTIGFGDEVYWKVLVNGTGRTTGDISIAPPSTGANAFFISRDPESGQIQQPYSQRLGEQSSITEAASTFTPGLPPVPFQIEFRYDDTYVPSATLRFLAFRLQFVDDSLLGDQDRQWRRAARSDQFFLPITVLPELTE